MKHEQDIATLNERTKTLPSINETLVQLQITMATVDATMKLIAANQCKAPGLCLKLQGQVFRLRLWQAGVIAIFMLLGFFVKEVGLQWMKEVSEHIHPIAKK